MYMWNLIGKILIISGMLSVFAFFAPMQEVAAQTQYTDSVTFRIDSVQIVGNSLIYSVMFKRTNQDWRGTASSVQDTVLGNVDLYFWLNDVIFDKEASVLITRMHPNIGTGSSLLTINARYHAMRFLIQLKAENTAVVNPNLVGVPYHDFEELCQIQMPLQYTDRNLGFRWDSIATGGQSNIGEPLIMSLQGDILTNPDPNLKLEDYSKIVYACEGDRVKLWAQGYSAGTQQTMTWSMSDDPAGNNVLAHFSSNLFGPVVGSGQVHYAGSVEVTGKGTLNYEISADNAPLGSRVDTLILLHAPDWLDGLYFQCELSDASLSAYPKKSNWGETKVIIRDSLFGWFAASDPSERTDGSIGASDVTDTVFKCPSTESYVSFFFFGPASDEMEELVGNELSIVYGGRDKMANPLEGMITLTSWTEETGVTAPNGKALFKGTVLLPDSLTNIEVWVSSISTEKGCHNGAAYAPYDTVHIRNLDGPDVKVLASLTDTTLTSGESMTLNNKYNYTDYALKSALGSTLDVHNKIYHASATPCTDDGGCADTIVYYYEVPTAEGKACRMEVNQVVHLSDWYYLSVKVFLEGAFLSTDMTDFLHKNNYLPLTSPYTIDGENLRLAAFPASKNIVDWIYVSIRKGKVDEVDQVVAEMPVFLLTDGSVCDTEGKPYLRLKNLNPSEQYFVVVGHRNHLLTRSKQPYTFSTSMTQPTMVDFTNPDNVAGNLVLLGTNLYGLIVGDVLQAQLINAAGLNQTIREMAFDGYIVTDLDFNGLVNAMDLSIVKKNMGESTGLYLP